MDDIDRKELEVLRELAAEVLTLLQTEPFRDIKLRQRVKRRWEEWQAIIDERDALDAELEQARVKLTGHDVGAAMIRAMEAPDETWEEIVRRMDERTEEEKEEVLRELEERRERDLEAEVALDPYGLSSWEETERELDERERAATLRELEEREEEGETLHLRLPEEAIRALKDKYGERGE